MTVIGMELFRTDNNIISSRNHAKLWFVIFLVCGSIFYWSYMAFTPYVFSSKRITDASFDERNIGIIDREIRQIYPHFDSALSFKSKSLSHAIMLKSENIIHYKMEGGYFVVKILRSNGPLSGGVVRLKFAKDKNRQFQFISKDMLYY